MKVGEKVEQSLKAQSLVGMQVITHTRQVHSWHMTCLYTKQMRYYAWTTKKNLECNTIRRR